MFRQFNYYIRISPNYYSNNIFNISLNIYIGSHAKYIYTYFKLYIIANVTSIN